MDFPFFFPCFLLTSEWVKGRDRNINDKHDGFCTPTPLPTGDGAHNRGMCPDGESNHDVQQIHLPFCWCVVPALGFKENPDLLDLHRTFCLRSPSSSFIPARSEWGEAQAVSFAVSTFGNRLASLGKACTAVWILIYNFIMNKRLKKKKSLRNHCTLPLGFGQQLLEFYELSFF